MVAASDLPSLVPFPAPGFADFLIFFCFPNQVKADRAAADLSW